MLFHSLAFIIFFAVVYPAYLLAGRKLRAQNTLLLCASLIFYAYWDWRFVGLLILSTGVDFLLAQRVEGAQGNRRKLYLILCVSSNLTALCVFKYLDFLLRGVACLLGALGLHVQVPTWHVVLPLGISFYTFQAIGYVIDVYRRELPACRSVVDYALFISFFPHLIAGPIQRAALLIPQITNRRIITADQVQAAIFLLLWGAFKKLVIADNMAQIADPLFAHPQDHHGADVLLGALAFTVQIYCDFSGYSDIARGLSKSLGFELPLNFRLPYYAVSPADFWRRWHASLSGWLRDYLYIPLGGNRHGPWRTCRNLMITMVLGGLWHGAAWSYVLWGLYHGVLLVAHRMVGGGRGGRTASALRGALMFVLTTVGWVIFRARTTEDALHILRHIGLQPMGHTGALLRRFTFFLLPLLCVQIAQRRSCDLMALTRLPIPWLALLYAGILITILIFGARDTTEFIYFHF